MKYIKHYQCTECEALYPADTAINLCPLDGRPVQMILDVGKIAKEHPSMRWYHPQVNNMWRFGPLLPFDISSQFINDVIKTDLNIVLFQVPVCAG